MPIRMTVFARCSVAFLISLFQIGYAMAPFDAAQTKPPATGRGTITFAIWTDNTTYSSRDAVKLNASLQNSGDSSIYVDRRMFWTGFGGGLQLEIRDQDGSLVRARPLSDAIMPPPSAKDASILIRLDEGYFYGTFVKLKAKDFFPKPGKYSIRVIYKSWLDKDSVAPQLRELPALWADTPPIASNLIWIAVT
jgi:hypothetical protein